MLKNAYIVATLKPKENFEEIEDQAQELGRLANTLDLNVVACEIVNIVKPDPAHFIGTGKMEEIKEKIGEKEVSFIIFNDDLAPTQHSNLEKFFEKRVIERSELILEIFANNARTRVSKTQVEIAKLEYLLPRLKRRWPHLSRQRGGVGLKGLGEKQIELDRRYTNDRIAKLNRELKAIEKEKEVQRKKRKEMFSVVLAGYTNSGKSSMLKALTGFDAYIENKLFATLDPKSQAFPASTTPKIVVSDTVGFIRKLPHHLVASFKSTLDEITDCNLILHVVDISHKNCCEQMCETENVLRDLGAHEKSVIYVFNKIDLVKKEDFVAKLLPGKYRNSVLVSAKTGFGIEGLKKRILEEFEKTLTSFRLKIPYTKMRLLQVLRKRATILSEKYSEKGVTLKVLAKKSLVDKIRSEF